MKKTILFLLISLSFTLLSQVPDRISYQGVARSASGSFLANQSIGVKIKIHKTVISGPIVYEEIHTATTNQFGLFNLVIGGGFAVSSSFVLINWDTDGPFFLEVLMDPLGGTSYTSIGTQQLLSVPYALYAKKAGSLNASFSNDTLYIGTRSIYISPIWTKTASLIQPRNNADRLAIGGSASSTGAIIYSNSSNTLGQAGYFEIQNTSNAADALYSKTNGKGASINAVCGAAVSGSSNLALRLEDGHIGSTSGTLSVSVSGCTSCLTLTLASHSTDVAGTLRASFSSIPTASITISVTFSKPYTKYPVVMIVPSDHPSASANYPKYEVSPIGVAGNYTGFNLTILSGSVNMTGLYGCNYMIIEGKN